MTNTPIILVPGFWLGAWAWNEVAATLSADGHDVTALTLPGLECVIDDDHDIPPKDILRFTSGSTSARSFQTASFGSPT